MLMDLISITLGFATVMLLLSLIVTGFVQMTVSVFDLRSKNLRLGLSYLFKKLGIKNSDKLALDLLEKNNIIEDKRFLGMTANLKSEIERDFVFSQLEDSAIQKTNKFSFSLKPKDFSSQFDRLELEMAKRFLLKTKLIVIIWSLIVAFGFQVSAIDLLHKLSDNPEYRDKITQISKELQEDEILATSLATDAEKKCNEVVGVLSKKYVELEEMSCVGEQKNQKIEIQLIMADLNRDRKDIEHAVGIFDEMTLIKVDIRDTKNKLSAIGISPWKYGNKFYLEGTFKKLFSNWFGVLLTCFFLTLGAPFWFNQLKVISNLRDQMSDKRKSGKSK